MVELSVIRDLVAIFGVIAGFSYYVLTVRNNQKNQQLTLETRQAQLFNSLYQRFSSSDYSKQYLTCMLMKWDDYEDWVKKYPDDCDEALQFYSLCNWYKTMNLLIFDGYVSPEAMARLIAFDFFGFWEKFKPIVEGMRRNVGEAALSDLDMLYATLKNANKSIDPSLDGFNVHFKGTTREE